MKTTLKISDIIDADGTNKDGLSQAYKHIFSTIVSSTLSVCAGLSFGFSATLLPQLKNDTEYPYDEAYDSWIASITPLSCVLGCLLTGSLIDGLGRKAGHYAMTIVFIFSWIAMGFSNNNIYMLVGRFLAGLSIGANRPITLVYLGEISDPKYRGITLTMPSLSIASGILICHAAGGYVNWRTCCFIFSVPNILSIVLIYFLKESPLWLISKGRVEEGERMFRWFRGNKESADLELKKALEKQKESSKPSIKDLFKINFVKPMLTVTLLSVATQFCGVNLLTFYAQDLFEKTFSGEVDAFLLMLVTDFIRILVITFICAFIKNLPRKITFLFMNFSTSVVLCGLIAYLIINPPNLAWMSFLLIILYMSLGGGIVTLGWSFVPELFPAKLRGVGSGLSSAITFFFLFICIKITPDVMRLYGKSAMYALCGVVTTINAVVLCFLLPETNGRSLQDIEDSYNKSEKIVTISSRL